MIKNMDEILNNTNIKIEVMELSNNSFDNKSTLSVYNDFYLNSKRKFKIDIFESLYFLSPERLERTCWLSPVNSNINNLNIYQSLCRLEEQIKVNDSSHLGIPLYITKKRGKKPDEKDFRYCFIEFIHPNSANRLLKAATKTSIINKSVKVYKAGCKPEKFMTEKKNI
jgi:hypothetical protein